MAQDPEAAFPIAALDFEHLRELELRKTGMGEIERHRHAGDAIGCEPLIREPVMGPHQPAPFQLGVHLGDVLLDFGPGHRQMQVAQPRGEELLVRPRRPFGVDSQSEDLRI